MAISNTPDWRWLSHREDTPWYPSLRIFRQADRMVWGPVFERMAAELAAMVPTRVRTPSVRVGIAPGELLEKIAILEIQAQRIADPARLRNLQTELAELSQARDQAIFDREGIASWTGELKAVNEALWSIQEELRACEQAGDFGPRFIELARSVSRNNDHRAALKRQINERLGSRFFEEKS
jgi:hypothetical protein